MNYDTIEPLHMEGVLIPKSLLSSQMMDMIFTPKPGPMYIVIHPLLQLIIAS